MERLGVGPHKAEQKASNSERTILPPLSSQLLNSYKDRMQEHREDIRQSYLGIKVARLRTALWLRAHGIDKPGRFISLIEQSRPYYYPEEYSELRKSSLVEKLKTLKKPTQAIERANILGVKLDGYRLNPRYSTSLDMPFLTKLDALSEEQFRTLLKTFDSYRFIEAKRELGITKIVWEKVIDNGLSLDASDRKALETVSIASQHTPEIPFAIPLEDIFTTARQVRSDFRDVADNPSRASHTQLEFMTFALSLSTNSEAYRDILARRQEYSTISTYDFMQKTWTVIKSTLRTYADWRSTGGVINLLATMKNTHPDLQTLALEDIVGLISTGGLNSRTEIENVQARVIKLIKSTNYLQNPNPLNRFMFGYVLDALPMNLNNNIGVTGIISEARDAADKISKLDGYRYEGIHQMVHNYPTPTNLDVLRALLHKDPQRYNELLERLNSDARPRISPDEVKKGLPPRALNLARKLERYLTEIYQPNFRELTRSLKNLKRDIPNTLYAALVENLSNITRIKRLNDQEVIPLGASLGELRLTLRSSLPTLEQRAIPTLTRIDSRLEDTAETILTQAMDRLSQKISKTNVLDTTTIDQVTQLTSSLVKMLASSGITPSTFNGIEEVDKLIQGLQSGKDGEKDPITILAYVNNLVLPLLSIGYNLRWQEISAGVGRTMATNYREKAGVTQREAEQYVYDKTLIDFYKASPLFSVENQLKRLQELTDTLSERVRKGTIRTVNSSQDFARQTLKEIQAQIQPLLSRMTNASYEGVPPRYLKDAKRILEESLISSAGEDPVHNLIDRQNNVVKHPFAQAYNLLCEVSNGVLNERELHRRGIYVSEVAGVPIIVIVKNGNVIDDPMEELRKIYPVTQAMINYALNRWRGD